MKSLIRLNDLLQSCTTQAEAYQVVGQRGHELFAGQSGGLAICRRRINIWRWLPVGAMNTTKVQFFIGGLLGDTAR